MLRHALLERREGLRLLGVWSDFDALRGVLHDVANRSPLIRNKDETPFHALACALRKACGHDHCGADTGCDLTTDVSWVCLLVTARVLRDSLAFMDHGKRHQAMTYALEAAIHDGLREDFGESAKEVLDAWYRLPGNDITLLERYPDAADTFASWSAKMREKSLAEMIDRLAAGWIKSPHLVVVE